MLVVKMAGVHWNKHVYNTFTLNNMLSILGNKVQYGPFFVLRLSWSL